MIQNCYTNNLLCTIEKELKSENKLLFMVTSSAIQPYGRSYTPLQNIFLNQLGYLVSIQSISLLLGMESLRNSAILSRLRDCAETGVEVGDITHYLNLSRRAGTNSEDVQRLVDQYSKILLRRAGSKN